LTYFHNLSIEDSFRQLNSSVNGLSNEEVASRLKKYGLNKLPEKKLNTLIQFFNQFKNPLIIILVFAGTISFLLQRDMDSVIIFIAVLITATLSFWQEFNASKTSLLLKKKLKKYSNVKRDGKEFEIETKDLVPGDILILKSGDIVGADGRIIKSFHLKVNESVLTGESFGIEKNEKILPLDTPLAERKNLVFAGTYIEDGNGLALVTETGAQTEFGKIASELTSIKDEKSPLQKDISKLARFLGAITIILTVLLFFIGILRNLDTLEMFLTSVAIAVAAIPEGLPAATTIILAIGMNRILKKQGLIKRISAVETLGRASVILTDKTGTLTKGEMRVSKVIAYHKLGLKDNHFPQTDKTEKEFISLSKKVNEAYDYKANMLLLKVAAITSEAFIENPNSPFGKWRAVGRPTEKALIIAATQAGLDKEELLAEEPRIDFLPFNPERKLAISLHRIETENHNSKHLASEKNIIYYSGAPEVILKSAKYIYDDGRIIPLNKEIEESIDNKLNEVAAQGERVMAMGLKHSNLQNLQNNQEEIMKDLVFVGFISFNDPLREEVIEALKFTKKAGLRTIIVTGDHALTAKTVAKNLGLDIKLEEIISGKELENMDDKQLEKLVRKINLYYRTTPKQKLKIVEAWKRNDQIVAMIGDGVNDAPAIKRADIGVAVGSGTDVAKDAADLILINNSFRIIVDAIKESLVIINNIRKTLTYLLSTTFTEIVLIGASLVLLLPLPVLPSQILWANIVGGGLLSVSLAFEPGEKKLIEKSKKEANQTIFTREMKFLILIVGIITDIILFLLFLTLLKLKLDINHLRTLMFLGLSLDAIVFVIPLKSLYQPFWKVNLLNNKFLIIALIISLALMAGSVSFDSLRKMLNIVSPSLWEWLILAGLAGVNLAFIEWGKHLFIKEKKSKNDIVKSKIKTSTFSQKNF